MEYLSESNSVDFTVVHKHLSEQEVNEISAFIEQYKTKKLNIRDKDVEATNADELTYKIKQK